MFSTRLCSISVTEYIEYYIIDSFYTDGFLNGFYSDI